MAGMLRKKKKPKNHYQNFKRDTETLRILINIGLTQLIKKVKSKGI